MRYAALPLAVAALIATTECRADEVPPSGDAAIVAGAATIVLPLSVGSLFVAQGDTLHVRNAGVAIMEGGLVLAPFVAHAAVGEYRRGLAFSAVPATFAVGTATLLMFVPDTIDGGKLHIQYIFAATFIGAFLGSTIGIVDALLVGDRARDRSRAPRLSIAPIVSHGLVGISLGGTL